MIYGYARVSTPEQKLELQVDALKKAGCEKIYAERASAAKERPELNKLIKALQTGDTVIVWKLDRLGRSLRHLIDTVKIFDDKGVKFQSLMETIDTSNIQGRLMLNIFATLAEFERELIRERTNAGLAAARARGRKGGRPPGLKYEAQLKAQQAKKLYDAKKLSIDAICTKLDISKKTLYRWIKVETPDIV